MMTAAAANTALGLRAASCQQDSLTRCTDPLKVLTNNRDLGFAASQQELNTLCPSVLFYFILFHFSFFYFISSCDIFDLRWSIFDYATLISTKSFIPFSAGLNS
jgi:hypothetical protein